MNLEKKDIFLITIFGLFAFAAVLFALMSNPVMSVFAAAGIFLAFIMLRDYRVAMGIAIIALPLSSLGVMQSQILGIPGFKPINLVFLLFIISFLLSGKQKVILEKSDIMFFIIYSIFFLVGAIRSISYIPDVYSFFWEGDFSVGKYMLSHWMIPYVISVFFLMFIIYIRSDKDINLIISCLFVSAAVFSTVVIYAYIFLVKDKSQFEEVRTIIGALLGMHGNGLSQIYIIIFPVLLTFTLRNPSILRILVIAQILFAVAILYSRTAYFTILLSGILVLFIMKKFLMIPFIAVIIALIIAVVPGNVVERATTGLEDSNVNDISAGRLDNIWIPILIELEENPSRILTGYGHYGIVATEAYKTKKILQVNGVHNTYLDTVVDSGIFCLLMFLMFYFKVMKNMSGIFNKTKNNMHKDLSAAILISIVLFFVKGMTVGSFTPGVSNSYMWVLLALGCIMRYREISGDDSSDIAGVSS